VEKDIQPPFWSPIPSFGVLLSQPAPSGARLRHFYFHHSSQGVISSLLE
jgi:hypothetical protein